MPLNDSQRIYVSEVVKGVRNFDNTNGFKYELSTITLTNANNANAGDITTASVEPIGVPVIYDSVNDQWVIYNDNDADIAGAITADDSTLPNRAPIAIVVGNEFGFGFNPDNVTLDADGEDVTALYRGTGEVAVVRSGIQWTAGGVTTSTANQDAFVEQLEKQGIAVLANATVVVPQFES